VAGSRVASDTCADAPAMVGSAGGEEVCGLSPGSPEGVALWLDDGEGLAVPAVGEGGDGTADFETGAVTVASGLGSELEQPEVVSIATMPTQATPRRTGIHTQKG